MATRKYTTQEIIEALRKANGLVSLAARALGCDPMTIYRRAKQVAAVRQVMADARSELVDMGEQRLRQAIQSGQPWAVALVLRTLGKDRGYVERQETVNKAETLEVITKVVRHAADD